MNQRTFDELISRIADNNKNALDEFYQNYGKLIYGVAFSVCKNKSDSDEVVDEVLIKIWNTANALHGIEKPKSWLYRVTFRLAINKINSRLDACTIEERAVEEEGYEKVIDKITFYEIIAGLKEIEQHILCFKFIEDMTFAEIAEITEKPLDTIAYEYYSALKKLKKQLDKFM
jgi:RNA polymerase sigma-70 factor (ECF subfamily)